MKKRILTLFVLVGSAVLTSCGGSSKTTTFTNKTLPLYINSKDKNCDIEVTYVNDDTSIPFISFKETAKLVMAFYSTYAKDTGFKLTASETDDYSMLLRENNAGLTVDYKSKHLLFSNYDQFVQMSFASNPLDILGAKFIDDNGKESYVKRIDGPVCNYKVGTPISIDLGKYNIPLYKGYLPLQTVADFLISCENGGLLCNNQSLIISSGKLSTDLANIYYSGPTGKRSESLIDFSYNEACLFLDSFYGLKEEHGIDSFNTFLSQVGLTNDLCGDDMVASTNALIKLVNGYFSDIHSGFLNPSFYLGNKSSVDANDFRGTSMKNFISNYSTLATYRMLYYPNGVPCYEEVGDTAYVTFDRFEMNKSDYYTTEPTISANDSVGVIGYAMSQINRVNSPINKVVLDLSLNLGGDADAAIYTISWMLGNGQIHLHDTFTGATSTTLYKADTNFDHTFDSKDDVTSKQLYCLTSPASFSCGNLVPAVLKESNIVTMLGQTSGGGACSVFPSTLADGSSFQISGYRKLCTLKNGSYYSIDRGVTPDYKLVYPSDFYDRAELTKYINTLK